MAAAAAAWLALCLPAIGSADERSRSLVHSAFNAAYNLDHADAIAFLDKAVQADPNDADAHRAVAVIAWLRIGFLRGSITVDDYLGSVSKPNINMLPPPAEEARRFQTHVARALELAEAEVRARPNDPEAHFRRRRGGRGPGVVRRHRRREDPVVVPRRAARLRRARTGAASSIRRARTPA